MVNARTSRDMMRLVAHGYHNSMDSGSNSNPYETYDPGTVLCDFGKEGGDASPQFDRFQFALLQGKVRIWMGW